MSDTLPPLPLEPCQHGLCRPQAPPHGPRAAAEQAADFRLAEALTQVQHHHLIDLLVEAMGQAPQRLADFEDDIRVIRALLNGESVRFAANGLEEDITFQSLELDYINIDSPVPIHVSAFGPRAQALAGRLGDGLITGIPRGGSIPEALANARQGAASVGRELDSFETYALVNLLMLAPGEALDSKRVLDEVGSSIMVNVHFMYDRFRETGAAPPEYVGSIWDDYVRFRQQRDARRSFTEAHSSHYGHLDPDEARFVTPEIVRRFCIAGDGPAIVQQLVDLEVEGLDGINFIAPAARQHELCEQFAREVITPLRDAESR